METTNVLQLSSHHAHRCQLVHNAIHLIDMLRHQRSFIGFEIFSSRVMSNALFGFQIYKSRNEQCLVGHYLSFIQFILLLPWRLCHSLFWHIMKEPTIHKSMDGCNVLYIQFIPFFFKHVSRLWQLSSYISLPQSCVGIILKISKLHWLR